jgi:hypothetical protein
MNLFVLFGDGAITRKKLTETLHVSRQFLGGYTPSPKKKINSFLNY